MWWTTYAAWRAGAFTAGEVLLDSVSGRDADPDGDRMPNWREWLHGSLPKDGSSTGRLGLRREGGDLVLEFTRLASMPADHLLRAARSTNLLDWSGQGVAESAMSTTGGVDRIEARWSNSGMGFMRIEYREP